MLNNSKPERPLRMDENKCVWIVIPSWNRKEDLLACLASLNKILYKPYEILVIDNASEDQSVEAVKHQFPNVQCFSLSENLGAAVASNIGFEIALSGGADMVLRLDSDTIVTPNFLSPLVNFMVLNPDIGIISPKILYYQPSDVIWYAGADAHPFHFGSTSDLIGKKDSEVSICSREVDYAWGAAMLIRREVLEKIGGFDTKFFIYYEEVDFCLRVKNLKYKIYYLDDSKIWHKVGTSKPTSWTAYQWNRSKILLYRKHAKNIFHMLSLILYAYSYTLIAHLIKGEFSGNRGPLSSAVKGLWIGLTESLTKSTSHHYDL